MQEALRQSEFSDLINQYKGIISKICRVYADNPEDFHDYFQEAALQLWRSLASFRGDAAISTWIYRVTLNVCLLQNRRKKKHNQIIFTDQLPHGWYEEPGNAREEMLQQLYGAIRKLKKADRALIFLYLEDKSYQEISDIMGISVTNVGVKINRIKHRIKELLNG